VVLFGVVLFFHGVEDLLDLACPGSAGGQVLYGLSIFFFSTLVLSLNRSFVDATGYDDEADDDVEANRQEPPPPRRAGLSPSAIKQEPLPRRGSLLPSPIKTSCGQWLLRHPLHIRLFGRRSVACHADVWAVATCNGAALCTAWAGINYVLEAAPKVASPDAAHAPGKVALLYVLAGNVVLVANRQLYHQFHSRMDLSASHVLEYE